MIPRLFIASTGQHMGKTTTSLGLLNGLKRHFGTIGFMKPIGQEHTATSEGVIVDKDVPLFKQHFQMKTPYEVMSPVLFPKGFTRDYLDGKVNTNLLKVKIETAFNAIAQESDFVLAEGTGHVGVGSIVELNNAEVAQLLKSKMVLIASGGLGSSFDALALNKLCCDLAHVPVAGVILNRVLPDKRDMVMHYMEKALQRWNIPILGCIPYDPFLSNPTIQDFESLFNTTLLAGDDHRWRHFKHTRLITTSLESFQEVITSSLLTITSAQREDIILALLQRHWEHKIKHNGQELELGLILTGHVPPSDTIIEELKRAEIPVIYTPLTGYKAVQMITSYTVKIRYDDVEKIREAIDIVQQHVDFDRLIEAVKAH